MDISEARIGELKDIFKADPNFCPACGAIIIFPARGLNIICNVCQFVICFSEIIGHETSYEVDFVPLTSSIVQSKKLDKEELGQMDNERECSKCGNVGMSYTTMQLRSADEGQTIFYICPKCKHREVENS